MLCSSLGFIFHFLSLSHSWGYLQPGPYFLSIITVFQNFLPLTDYWWNGNVVGWWKEKRRMDSWLWMILESHAFIFLFPAASLILPYELNLWSLISCSGCSYLLVSSLSYLVLLPYSSAVPNCQVFILENCWTGQNILGHDYKRKRGELRSTDLWIPFPYLFYHM